MQFDIDRKAHRPARPDRRAALGSLVAGAASAAAGLSASASSAAQPKAPSPGQRPGTAFFSDEKTFWHTGGEYALVLPVGGWVEPATRGGFAESPDSKRRFRSLVEVSGLVQHVPIRSAPAATEQDLLRVHPKSYIDDFRALSEKGGGDLGDFAPFGRGSFEIAQLSAGLAVQALAQVLNGSLRNAYALSRPPGHHCMPTRPMGFCLLANIAIAIEAARAAHPGLRVAVVDWDVHHGNGTQAAFYERRDVLTISLHQENCFPPGYSGAGDRGQGDGLGYNVNIPLLPGGGHDAYLYAMDRIVMPLLDGYKPDLIVVASGIDANAVDPLARMQLHSDTYRAMTARMKEAAERHCAGKLVMVHEGGYAESYVPFCGLAIVEELTGVRTPVVDPMLGLIQAQQPSPRFAAFQRELLDEQARALKLAA
ncbi:class II histone deacetylase [Schlegelella sp. S2-27]|uniref:Class II histone deacetylase n=1 Tax=Caldimonas mangrovi TaxID=2944811 RepID=A0ABT0YW04_9BURK|nr:class II histone deacetylase [Caldimonas mangrovi]MCM5682291.1 class II histone deacetylase [Caldimonas mangrovi]